MKSILKLARWASEELEQLPISVGAWCALFVGIVLVRDLIEGFSGALPLVHPVDFFLHYPLAFINPLLTLAILLSLGSGVALARVTRIMLVMWSLVLIPPVADLALGAVGAVADKAHIGFAPVFRGEYLDRFVHFFNPGREFQGTTAGIRIECFVEVLLAFAYVLLKRDRLWRGIVFGIPTALIVYIVSLAYFTWPFHPYNLITPAADASLHDFRLFIVEYGTVAREHFDRFSHASGGMHALLFALLCVVWLGLHRVAALGALLRVAGPPAALGGTLAAGGLLFGIGRFVMTPLDAFEPTFIDGVFMACGVVAAMAAMVPAAIFSGEAANAGLRRTEQSGVLIASLAIAMINAWLVSYAVFTVMMVALAISVLRTVPPFVTDRLPGVAQCLRGLQSVCLGLVGLAVFARADTVRIVPSRLMLWTLAAATLAACHRAGSGAVARGIAEGRWIDHWVSALPVWRRAAQIVLWSITSTTRAITPALRWLPLAAPWVLWSAYPSWNAMLTISIASTLLYAAFTLVPITRGLPAATVLAISGSLLFALLGSDARVAAEVATESPRTRAELALGHRLLWSDHVDLAMSQYERVMAMAPRTYDAYRNAIGARSQSKDFDGAVAYAERAVESLPGSATAWKSLGDVRTQAGEFREALNAYHRAIDIEGAGDLDFLRRAAVTAGLAKDGREALFFARQGLAKAPDDPFFGTSELSAGLSLWATAAAESLETYRNRAADANASTLRELRYLEAAALVASGDAQAAAGLYANLASADPSDPLCCYLGGLAELRAENPDRALDLLDRVVEMRPSFAAAYSVRAQAHAARQDRSEYRRDLARSIELAPRNADVHLDLALSYLRAGEGDDAFRVLSGLPRAWATRHRHAALAGAIRAFVDSTANAKSGAGLDEIPSSLRSATITDPLVLLAFTRPLIEARAVDAAAAVFEFAQEVAPDDPRPSMKYGALLLRAGRHEEAATALRKAIDVGAGDQPRVYQLLASAYEGMGRDDLADAARGMQAELERQDMGSATPRGRLESGGG
ncbi:MAG: hypothetical protein CME06_00600 [Gemmatimonadetes bacterium]|nr:hypothetical protein [Gemmatimonadota bacterium]